MSNPDINQIQALVSLLGDEDPKVFTMVTEHLLELGATAIPFLQKATEESDPRLRLRARHVLQRLVLDEIERELEEMGRGSDEDFDLERGFFAVARVEYPDLEFDSIRSPLDELAERIAPRLQGVEQPLDQVRIINQVLFDEYKLTGNSRDYYDADNAYLHRVLERRTGIPITLAAIYLLVARRLELPIFGVGLPSSFLVRYGHGDRDIFIDPFLGGKLLGRRDCVQYLTSAGYYYKDAYISNSTSRDMIVRTLRHLVVVYSKQQDRTRTRRLSRYAEVLQTRARTR